MPKASPKRFVGTYSQRLSDEESPCTETSSELLSRFLSSVDMSGPRPPRSWESNPLYKELKRTLQGTIQMTQVDALLREKYRRASTFNTHPSVQSSATTISSTHTTNLTESERNPSNSTLDSDEPLWWTKHSTRSGDDEYQACSTIPTSTSQKSLVSSEISSGDESVKRCGSSLKAKAGLEGLQGIWKLKVDEPVRLLDLCRLMELDVEEMERREEHVTLEIRLVGHTFCVKSEIFGLYNVEVPLNGEMSTIPRIDQHDGEMSAHIEIKRMGLRMIYTWDHPAAATRRDNYEVSSNGDKLVLTAYLMQRDGHYCKVKWQFDKKGNQPKV